MRVTYRQMLKRAALPRDPGWRHDWKYDGLYPGFWQEMLLPGPTSFSRRLEEAATKPPRNFTYGHYEPQKDGSTWYTDQQGRRFHITRNMAPYERNLASAGDLTGKGEAETYNIAVGDPEGWRKFTQWQGKVPDALWNSVYGMSWDEALAGAPAGSMRATRPGVSVRTPDKAGPGDVWDWSGRAPHRIRTAGAITGGSYYLPRQDLLESWAPNSPMIFAADRAKFADRLKAMSYFPQWDNEIPQAVARAAAPVIGNVVRPMSGWTQMDASGLQTGSDTAGSTGLNVDRTHEVWHAGTIGGRARGGLDMKGQLDSRERIRRQALMFRYPWYSPYAYLPEELQQGARVLNASYQALLNDMKANPGGYSKDVMDAFGAHRAYELDEDAWIRRNEFLRRNPGWVKQHLGQEAERALLHEEQLMRDSKARRRFGGEDPEDVPPDPDALLDMYRRMRISGNGAERRRGGVPA